jgi:hypothetical protein
VAEYTGAAIEADFKTKPYVHQLREFEEHAGAKARALFWQMRTGKTKVMIDTACYLNTQGEVDVVLVIAPNGVHDNWVRRELPIHHWDSVPYEALAWQTDIAGEMGITRVKAAEREEWQRQHDAWWEEVKRLLKAPELTWWSIASDTMTRDDVRRLVQRVVRWSRGRLMVIFDESHDFRTPGSKRTSMGRAISRKAEYKRTLTGTPVHNSPLHAWSQFELLEEGALGFTKYGDFKDHHAVYVTKKNRKGQNYPVLDSYKNLDELRDKMAEWTSVVLRSDCEDLPDLVRSTRAIELTDEQLRVYRELHRSFEFELDGKTVSVGEDSAKLVKLQQVVSGFVRDEFGDDHDIPGRNPRLEALVDEVSLTDGKVIVWCAFHVDMDKAAAALRAAGHEVCEYHGRVSDADKRKARELMGPDAENDVKALVGYPTPGLDLSGASKVIWYSHTFDAIKREQGEERATAMHGENVPVVDFEAPGIDGYILTNVRDKVSIADALSRDGLSKALRRMKL